MPKLVEGYVNKLQVPAAQRDVQVFDDTLPGFGIRKFESGRASYFVKFNVGRQQRRLTLGAVVQGNLADMRRKASTILSKARLGQDAVAASTPAVADPFPAAGLAQQAGQGRVCLMQPASEGDAIRLGNNAVGIEAVKITEYARAHQLGMQYRDPIDPVRAQESEITHPHPPAIGPIDQGYRRETAGLAGMLFV